MEGEGALARPDGRAVEFVRSALVLAVFSSEAALIKRMLERWADRFGGVDLESAEFAFDFTRYYRREMGTGLRKKFVSFSGLVDSERLVEIKKLAIEDEEGFRNSAGGRLVNLDPGFVSRHRVIVASRKDSPHRVPLSGGIYADLQLLYESGTFRPLEWTYPDYRLPETTGFFNRVRAKWLDRIKKEGVPPPGG